MSQFQIAAPGKLNLCLYLGPLRADGLHDLASLFESVSPADQLTAREVDGISDRVICEAVPGENLVELALRSAREAGLLSGPPLEVTIEKRVPIAAGMGGGSGDAAAALRLAATIEGRPIEDYRQLAFRLGADVPSQLTPGATLVRGAGEHVAQIEPRCLQAAQSRAYVIIEQRRGLSTAEVFKQADRTELIDPALIQREETLLEGIAAGLDLGELCELIENDLQPAILALRPELARLPELLLLQGALAAAFTGSGPTCFGVFDGLEQAEAAAAVLAEAGHLARVALPASADSAAPKSFVRESQ